MLWAPTVDVLQNETGPSVARPLGDRPDLMWVGAGRSMLVD